MAILQFLKSQGLNNSYEHTIDFDDTNAQATFWGEQVIDTFEGDISTSRLLAGTLNIDVGYSYKALMEVNYLRFYQDDKWWYCFVSNKTYINEFNTRLSIEIDVMQTFQFDFSLGYSFVEREHQTRYSSSGGPKYNLVHEDIDIGDTFVREKSKHIYDNVPSDFNKTGNYSGVQLFWAYIVAKEAITTASSYDTTITRCDCLPTNVYYYVAPIGFTPAVMIGGIEFLVNSTASTGSALTALTLSQFATLTEDPNVISITLSRYAPFDYTGTKTVGSIVTQYLIVPSVETATYQLQQYKPTGATDGCVIKINNANSFDKTFSSDIVEYNQDISNLKITTKKNRIYEPKLLTTQFCRFEIEQGKLKQELSIPMFNSGGYTLRTVFSVRQSQVFMPSDYANNGDFADSKFLNGTNYALNLDNTNNEMPLRTDAWLTYLSENKNSLISGLKTQALQSVSGIAQSIAGGTFGISQGIGAVTGAFSQVANSIAQIKDLKETPDTVSKPNIDMVENYLNHDLFYVESLYYLPSSVRDRVFNYLYTYGYAVKDFETPNLRSRYYFNFIKTTINNIQGDLSNEFIEKISQIFNKGITIWHYRDTSTWGGIENYIYENVEMSLIK